METLWRERTKPTPLQLDTLDLPEASILANEEQRPWSESPLPQGRLLLEDTPACTVVQPPPCGPHCGLAHLCACLRYVHYPFTI